MADGRLYWLKLKKDFFKRHDSFVIQSMENGHEHLLFYLKLMCESLDHDGKLRFSKDLPYTVKMLAAITQTDHKIAEEAIKVLEELKLVIQEEDGTFYLPKVSDMTISVSDTDAARRARRYRENQNELENDADGEMRSERTDFCSERTEKRSERTQNCSERTENRSDRHESIEYRDKSIENRDKKEKGKKEKVTPEQIKDLFNETCVSFPRVISLSESRKRTINARLKNYKMEDFVKAFEKAEASSFLKGSNSRDWSATFDWIMTDKNFAKILDGNYDNKEGSRQQAKPKSGNAKADKLESFYDMAKRWAEKGDGDE